MSFRLEVEGAFSARYSTPDLLVAVRAIDDPRLPTGVFLLIPKAPIMLGSGAQALPGVVVGAYEGDGRYSIGQSTESSARLGAGSPPTPPVLPPSSATSKAWVEYVSGGNHYNFSVGPCSIEVRRGGIEGTVRCSRLTDGQAVEGSKNSVSLLFSWGPAGGG
jgi:hypothetical protein